MLRFELKVIGAHAVANKYRTFVANAPRMGTNVTYDWAQSRVIRRMVGKPYPAMRPGQRYKRTYSLQGGWRARPTKSGAEIFNLMPYAGYVVGDGKGQKQAWMHRGRWWLMRDIVDDARPELTDMMRQAINLSLARGARLPK